MNSIEDALQRFLEANPDLPEGTDVPVAESVKPVRQRLVFTRERKGRAGKVATIISGFTLPDDEVAAIARQLKQRLAIGGSSRGKEILLQGDIDQARCRAILATLCTL